MIGPVAADVEMDRALGALLGVAIGDAMGMPSQTMQRPLIRALYGTIDDFVSAAPAQSVSAGLPAGTVTDDTEQTLLVARHLIERRGGFDDSAWARELLDWERDTHARGVNDLLGPSTKRALDALQRGISATEAGQFGTTNGAAMRIVPIGIAFPVEPLAAFVEAVGAACRLTHNTTEAVAAAAAVAAVVSAGVDGATFEAALPLALAAARAAGGGENPIAKNMATALDLSLDGAGLERATQIADRIGVSVAASESVPAAFAVARLARGDAWKAAEIAANIGGDTDTIGAIAAGMCGACRGAASLPADKVRIVVEVNSLDMPPIAWALLALRHGRGAGVLP